ncbi:hypothetical protein CHS0354_001666 [Potamilus streckersoni]|uniref:Uncharacterized protein n=1 Tax=Potamilus streckersoni TaxID=2493646 RepID=A0AAE0VKF3_9BIVA|nr:hypothetical protein CHS0354_001666 [Potamilus streckersoni]
MAFLLNFKLSLTISTYTAKNICVIPQTEEYDKQTERLNFTYKKEKFQFTQQVYLKVTKS